MRRWWVQCWTVIMEESWVVNVSKPCTHTRPSSLSFFEDGYETNEALYSYISRLNAYCTSNANTSQNTNGQLISWPSSDYISTYDDHVSPIWKRTTHETRGPDRSGPWWKWPFLRGDDKLLGFMAKLRWSCWAKNSVVWTFVAMVPRGSWNCKIARWIARGSLNLAILVFFFAMGGGTSILAYTCVCIHLCIYVKYIHVSSKVLVDLPFSFKAWINRCCLHPFWTQLLIRSYVYTAFVEGHILPIIARLSCLKMHLSKRFFICWKLASKNQEVWKLVMCS